MYTNLSESILKRKAIVDAAVELMDEDGLKNVTITDICDKAKISVGGFYHYFNSKDSMPFEMYRLLDEYLLLKKNKMLENFTTEEDIIDFVSYFGRYVEEWGYYANLIIMRASIENRYNQLDEGRKINNILGDIIQYGIDNKSFSTALDQEELKSSIFVIMRGYLLEWIKNPIDYSVEDKIIAHTKCFLNGIRNK